MLLCKMTIVSTIAKDNTTAYCLFKVNNYTRQSVCHDRPLGHTLDTLAMDADTSLLNILKTLWVLAV